MNGHQSHSRFFKVAVAVLFFVLSVSVNTTAQDWQQFGPDIPGVAPDDHSGVSVSLSDDGLTLAVGAFQNSDFGPTAGHVRVFTNDASSMDSPWVLKGDVIYGGPDDRFLGIDVSLSGDGNRLATCSSFSEAKSEEEQVYVFDWNGSSWEQLGEGISWESISIYYGSVALSGNGDVLYVGDHGFEDGGAYAGQVRAYTYNGSEWVQRGSAVNGVEDDIAGTLLSCSEDGNTFVTNFGGDVQVYEWNGTDYQVKGNLLSPFDISAAELNGDGTWLVVSGHNAEGESDNKGIVQTYTWSGGSWIQMGSAIQGEAQSYLGADVNLSDDAHVLAISSLNVAFQDPGEVWIYTYDGSDWQQAGESIVAEDPIESIGHSLSLNAAGNIIGIGYPNLVTSNFGLYDKTRVYRNDEVVGVEESISEQWSVFPNPFSDIINIQLQGTLQRAHLQLFDAQGIVVLDRLLSAQDLEVVRVDTSPGIYLLKLTSDQGRSHTLRLIKQ